MRPIAAVLASGAIAAGCGGASHARAQNSSVTALMATAPDSLDPAVGSNPEALEADWLVYTPLLTYVHTDGAVGTRVVPGLAQTLPYLWGGGRGYTFKLRPGLTYSNGEPVRASDFARAMERAIKLWPRAAQLIVPTIVGARRYADGRANTIGGVSTDDATGQITIYLTAPDGALENLLALPALAPVPAGTPLREEQTPPPGAGPYELADVAPGRSFTLERNPHWPGSQVPYVPDGRVDVRVRVTGDAGSDAQSVLENKADMFDWADPIPSQLLAQIRSTAADRYVGRTMQGTDLIFMNAARKPFSSQLAREAVRAGIDQGTLAALDAGMLQKGCFVVPPTLFGHPHDACPDGNVAGAGNLAAARSLLERSGMAGTQVVVWSDTDPPVQAWMSYYTSLLNQIGLNARLESIPDRSYYATIGDQNVQTGFDQDADGDLPDPAVLYQQLTGETLPPAGGHGWSLISDPYVSTTVRALSAVPASTVGAIQGFWAQLERYVANKGYVAIIGYRSVPEFVSSKIDFRDLILSPVAGFDWSSVRLN